MHASVVQPSQMAQQQKREAWPSQGMADFQATWSTVRKNGAALERVVAAIAHAAAFLEPEWATTTNREVLELHEFVDSMEAHCNEVR